MRRDAGSSWADHELRTGPRDSSLDPTSPRKYLLHTWSLVVIRLFSILNFGLCLKLLIKIDTFFSLRFNSLSNNLYEEVEKNQKWTENQFIQYEKGQVDQINQCLKLLQEKLVRSCVVRGADGRGVFVWSFPTSKIPGAARASNSHGGGTGVGGPSATLQLCDPPFLERVLPLE